MVEDKNIVVVQSPRSVTVPVARGTSDVDCRRDAGAPKRAEGVEAVSCL